MLQVDDFMERGDVIWYRFYYSVGLILGVIGIFFGLVVFVFFYKYVFFVWYFYFYLIVELEYKFFQYSVKSSLWVEEEDIFWFYCQVEVEVLNGEYVFIEKCKGCQIKEDVNYIQD